MNNSLSLRARLTLVILAPLLVIAAMIGVWAYVDAQRNAAERFDRQLLSTALAISRDVAVSDGDALSQATRDLLLDTSGGPVFYHVYAPDGVFVTGYATPPVAPVLGTTTDPQTYYDAIYRGDPVRALRLVQQASIDGLTGLFTFSVWQQTDVRDGFVQSRTRTVFLIIASMIGALAVIVWFGVRFGLTPLTDLEEAIDRRSSSDLSPIKRRIPPEVRGIVTTFNDLLGEVSSTMDRKNAFISDAAHQLRNPIAGVLSLAESVSNAKTPQAQRERSQDLLAAAKEAGHLANSLLTLERVQADKDSGVQEVFDPQPILLAVAEKFSVRAKGHNIAFDHSLDPSGATLIGDPVMFEQAVLNLLNNAIVHGGPQLTRIGLRMARQDETLGVTVSDNGKGIAETDFDRALGRFSQIEPSPGSGLGLPITAAVTQGLGGQIKLLNSDRLFSVTLLLPLAAHPTNDTNQLPRTAIRAESLGDPVKGAK